MVYMESVQRELEEQQDYEKEIHRDFAIKMAASKRPAINKAMYKRSEPRKARKYAYFDIETGELVFEYGGVTKPKKVTN